jgi:predicted transcriptional regulator
LKNEIDDDLKRVLDEHAAAAKKDKDYVSREQLMRDGIAKLKRPVPQ